MPLGKLLTQNAKSYTYELHIANHQPAAFKDQWPALALLQKKSLGLCLLCSVPSFPSFPTSQANALVSGLDAY